MTLEKKMTIKEEQVKIALIGLWMQRSVHISDLLTFLRACDEEDPDLKWYTTARVRHFMGLRYILAVNHDPLNAEKIKLRNMLLVGSPGHFRWHWWDAVQAIRDLFNYDLETEKEIPHDSK